jgi:hypothetical protein
LLLLKVDAKCEMGRVCRMHERGWMLMWFWWGSQERIGTISSPRYKWEDEVTSLGNSYQPNCLSCYAGRTECSGIKGKTDTQASK